MNTPDMIRELVDRIESPSVLHADGKIMFLNHSAVCMLCDNEDDVFRLYGKSVDAVFPNDTAELTDTVELYGGFSVSAIKKNAEHTPFSELKFKDVFQDHSAPMLLVDHTSGGRIVEANDSACRFYGYAHGELTSMTIDYLNILPMSDIMNEMNQANARQRNYFNFTHRLKDGNVRNVEVYSSPILHNSKKVLFSIVIDTTEKKLYEIQLRDMNKRLNKRISMEVMYNKEREKRYFDMFDMLEDAVILIRMENNIPVRFVYANDAAAELMEISKTELLNAWPMDIIKNDRLSCLGTLIRTAEKDTVSSAVFSCEDRVFNVSVKRYDDDGSVMLYLVFRKDNVNKTDDKNYL